MMDVDDPPGDNSSKENRTQTALTACTSSRRKANSSNPSKASGEVHAPGAITTTTATVEPSAPFNVTDMDKVWGVASEDVHELMRERENIPGRTTRKQSG